jgi:histidinol-phosphate/aromatic aminotransferase/cobyric acid decarboxylase-like protein/choline kinase
MQAIILAAGKGRRLGKHTEKNTKCMLRVAGKTLLERAVDALKEAGIGKLVLVVGYQAENLRQYVTECIQGIDVEFVENPEYATTNNIYSLWLAREHLAADDTILLESDLIFESGVIRALVDCPAPDAATVARYEQWMDGTVTLLDDSDRIVEFVEKKNFAFSRAGEYYKTVNIYKFSRDFSRRHYLPFLEAYIQAYGQNEYYEQVLKAIAHLAHSGLKAFKLTGQKWYEIDDAQDLDIAETLFAESAEQLVRYQKRYGGYWRFSGLLDFCYLVNPYFPTPELVEKLKYFLEPLLTQYPSGLYVQNLNAGRMFAVDESEIVVGNGAAELIGALGRLTRGTVAISLPTFNEYVRCFDRCEIVKIDSSRTGYRLTRETLLQAAVGADTVVVVNPDNPSGALLRQDDLMEVIQFCGPRGKRIVVDESFMDFAAPECHYTLLTSEWLRRHPHVVVIKSISKSYGVPGLRLGVLASGDPVLLDEVKRALPVWNINSFAEYFLQIFPPFQGQYQKSCDQIRSARKEFLRGLETVAFLKTHPSHANYFLCEVVDQFSATELARLLLSRYGFLIKDLTGKEGFEQGQFIRVAVRNKADNWRFVEALRDLC